MKRNLKRHLREEQLEKLEWTQWQAIQLRNLWEFRREYSADINVTFDRILPEAEKAVEEAFHEAAINYDANRPPEPVPEPIQVDVKTVTPTAEPVRVTAELARPDVDGSFFQINKPKLDAVINDVRRDMNFARYGAAQRMSSIHEDIVRKADLFFQSGTMTLDQAVEMAATEAAGAGLNSVQYADGRMVHIASYVEMALRTSSRRAALTAEGAKRDEFGEFLVTSPTLHSTCDTCQIWQGKVLIDDVFANGKPDGKHMLLSEAIAPPSHFLGPNCRHPLVTYYEGITKIPKESPYDLTREQYKAEERQRQIERYIRKYKRMKEAAMNEDTKERYGRKVIEWQEAMRRHLEENEHLRRKPQRERIA